jgi:hypothetical protein
MTDLEFVNDWSELEEALAILSDKANFGDDLGEFDCSADHVGYDVPWAIYVIKDYVPRLLTQYASLLEASFALTDAWEAANQNRTPEGLYLP